MFDAYGHERLVEWKNFRDSLESSILPLEDVALFWSNAPYVPNYLDPFDCHSWPNPWKLVLDGNLDDLAITLGMLYTLKLTQRFIDNQYEIHMSIAEKKKDFKYFLIFDNMYALNYQYRSVVPIDTVNIGKTTVIKQGNKI